MLYEVITEHVMEEKPIPILYIDEAVEREQVQSVASLRERRDAVARVYEATLAGRTEPRHGHVLRNNFV